MQSATCEVCGIEFEYYRSTKSGKYCSHECYVETQRTGQDLKTYECEQCGEEFEDWPSEERKYCTHECYAETQRTGHDLKTYECEYCGTEFEDWPGEERKYCSQECFGKSLRVRETVECEYCGTEFEALPSNEREYCSQSCVAKDIDREPPTPEYYEDYIERKRREFLEKYENDPEFREKVRARAKSNREYPEI